MIYSDTAGFFKKWMAVNGPHFFEISQNGGNYLLIGKYNLGVCHKDASLPEGGTIQILPYQRLINFRERAVVVPYNIDLNIPFWLITRLIQSGN